MAPRALWILPVLLLAQMAAQGQSLTTRRLGAHLVDVRTPARPVTADVLVLPGWRFAKEKWGRHTRLYRIADSLGWRLVMPEMGVSIYASRFYPETLPAYRAAPALPWVTDTLITTLQREGILAERGTNYLLGLSTGARGVARVAWATDTLFCAGVALSGDYAHLDTTDKLLIQSYGAHGRHRARWAIDEPQAAAASIRVPLYLAHAADDLIVPKEHSIAFSIALLGAQGDRFGDRRSLLMLSPRGGHDWPYWGAELTRALPWLVEHRR